MKTPRNKLTTKDRRWIVFNNGCIHGIEHSELVLVRSVPHRSLVRNTVAVFSISKAFEFILGLGVVVVLLMLLVGCALPRPQKGGGASTTISRPGQTNSVTLTQSENPKEPSSQTVQSEQTIEYVLPAGTGISFGDGRWEIGDRNSQTSNSQLPSAHGNPRTANSELPSSTFDLPSRQALAILDRPVPVRLLAKDRTETRIGGAQKDTVREWTSKAANMQPVMWAGIVMMTVVAGLLVYFGWWTKAAVAVAVGIGMVVLAQTLPDHGAVILLGGLGVFGLAALLILYAYYKGQLDKNQNGVPDILERNGEVIN